MAGNVREWVFDHYDSDYYEKVPPTGWINPHGPEPSAFTPFHSIRGGGYNGFPTGPDNRCAIRIFYDPDYSQCKDLGSRIAI